MPILYRQKNIDGNLDVFVNRLTTSTNMRRLLASDVVHHEAKVLHPNHAGIMAGGGSLFPISGKMSVVWNWSIVDNEAVLASIPAWEAIVQRDDITIEKFLDNREIIATVDGDYDHGDWVSHPFEYVPLSNKGQLVGDDSEVVCITRLANQTSWSTKYIHTSDDLTVNKTGSLCYVYCSAPIIVSGKQYDAHKVFNMASESAVITPTERCLVVMVSK